LIRLLVQTQAGERDGLRRLLVEDSVTSRAEISASLKSTDALSYTRARAEWYVQHAHEELCGLPASAALDTLHDLTDLILLRRE
jgi:geranylgeranyl pyrophosphate synthase